MKSILYAGHSAVFIEAGNLVIGIDPWIKDNPRCPENLKSPKKLDLIILSHGHSDHAGDALWLAKKYGATVAATFELAMILAKEGVPQKQIFPMNKGGTAAFGGVDITLTNAFH